MSTPTSCPTSARGAVADPRLQGPVEPLDRDLDEIDLAEEAARDDAARQAEPGRPQADALRPDADDGLRALREAGARRKTPTGVETCAVAAPRPRPR